MPTFLRPKKNGSVPSAALAVGGVGGLLLQTPNVAKKVPHAAAAVHTHNWKNTKKKKKKEKQVVRYLQRTAASREGGVA